MRVIDSPTHHPRLSIDFTAALSILLFALSFSIPSIVHAQRGAVTLPRNLADLSSNANQILQGRVISATVQPDPRYNHLQTLVLTLAVDDVLKGQAPATFTFRQFLWDLRDISDRAGYHIGDEVLLFLNRPTTLGLVSPVGLQQGRFRVINGSDGQTYAINGNGNSGLIDSAIASGALNPSKLSAKSRSSVQSFKQGPIALSALKEAVHFLVQGAPR
jgi:hypothetical protein